MYGKGPVSRLKDIVVLMFSTTVHPNSKGLYWIAFKRFVPIMFKQCSWFLTDGLKGT